jgi:hypothetical protein
VANINEKLSSKTNIKEAKELKHIGYLLIGFRRPRSTMQNLKFSSSTPT